MVKIDVPKFTGYFRDNETQLDYAKNRYHQPGMGRFLTADPFMQSAGPSDPGSWNRYAYTRGDPVNRVDRTGLDDDGLVADCGDYCEDQADTGSETESCGDDSDVPDYTPTPPLIDDGTLVNGTSVTVTDTAPTLGLVYSPPVATSPGIITQFLGSFFNGIGGLVTIFFASASTTTTTDTLVNNTQFDPNWVAKYCTAVGPPIPVRSTKKGNKGGWSIEQEYLCPDGNTYTIQTITGPNGSPPHVRPGGPKYGPGPPPRKRPGGN